MLTPLGVRQIWGPWTLYICKLYIRNTAKIEHSVVQCQLFSSSSPIGCPSGHCCEVGELNVAWTMSYLATQLTIHLINLGKFTLLTLLVHRTSTDKSHPSQPPKSWERIKLYSSPRATLLHLIRFILQITATPWTHIK